LQGDASRAIHSLGLEVGMCLEDPVACKKKEEQCLGSASGDLTARMNYDFATAVAIGELNPDVLGEDGYYAAAANCTVKTATIEVPFFEGIRHSPTRAKVLGFDTPRPFCAQEGTAFALSRCGNASVVRYYARTRFFGPRANFSLRAHSMNSGVGNSPFHATGHDSMPWDNNSASGGKSMPFS
jgi:hypothetical protein